MSRKSATYKALVIVEPKARDGATLIIDGHKFVLRGRIVRGLRALASQDKEPGT